MKRGLAVVKPRQVQDAVRHQPFSIVSTSDLVAILRGEMNVLDEAAFELNARCRDQGGTWVGSKDSGLIYEAFKEGQGA